MEEERFAASAVHAGHDRHAAELSVSAESTQHTPSLQECFALRLVAGSLRSAAFSSLGIMQSGHQRPIEFRRRLQVNNERLILSRTFTNLRL